MTFKQFEAIFKKHYPEGRVIAHGKMGGTEKNNKTTVIFNEDSRAYEYYGAYEDVLGKLGIKAISKARLKSLELTLERYREDNGKPSLFGGITDYSEYISKLENELEDIKTNYIIV